MSTVDQAYRKHIPDLQELDNYRLRRIRSIRINRFFLFASLTISLVLVFLTLFSDYFLKDDVPAILGIMGISLLFILLITAIIHTYQKSSYSEYFKKNIIAKLVPILTPGLSYQPENHISFDDFKKCNLFKQEANRIAGSDYFNGLIGDLKFNLSWLNVYSETTVKSYHKDFDDRHKRSKTMRGADVFNGVFIIVYLPQAVKSGVDIVPTFNEYAKWLKSASKALDIFGKSKYPEVDMQQPEFQEKFSVHCNDTSIAKSIVNPSIMEELIKLKLENKNYQVYVSYDDQTLFVAVDGAKGAFDPQIGVSLKNLNSVKMIFANLLKYINLTRKLTEGRSVLKVN